MRIRVRAYPEFRSSVPRQSEPVTFGVALPTGQVREPVRWTLSASAGAPRLVQARPLDWWPDGSVRWMLVDSRIDVDGRGPYEFVLTNEGAEATEEWTPIQIDERDDAVVVSTGVAQFQFAAGTEFPFVAERSGSGDVTRASAGRMEVTSRGDSAAAAVFRPASVEERGPLRSVILRHGTVTVGARRLDVIARVHLFAGSGVARVLATVRNPDAATHRGGFWDLGDPGSILIEDLTLVLTVPGQPFGPVRTSVEAGDRWSALRTPLEIYQDSSGGERWNSSNHLNRERRIPVSFRGYRVRGADGEQSGLRATPVVSAGGLSVAVPHFWQNFPQALEVGDAGIVLHVLPRQFDDLHEIQGGEQKTWEFFVGVTADPVTTEPLDWTRARTTMAVDPEWTMSTGAVPFLAPLDDAHAALVNAAVDGPDRFEAKREVIDEYGWRHFGEIYGDHEAVRQPDPPLVSHYNNQYDPVAGFGYQFLRTGDPRWIRMMAELAAHVIDIDVYHTSKDKSAYNGGLFWHTYHYGDADIATHRTYPSAGRGRTHGGGPSADHNYTTGLMLYWFLSGDHAARETVLGLAQYVLDMDDGRKTVFRWLDRGDTGRAATSQPGYYGPGRAPANSLNVLLDGFRLTGERRFQQKAEQLIRRVVHPNEDLTPLRLDEPEIRWFYLMFLQSLGKYLLDKAERDERDQGWAYARASLLHYARWMAAHEYPYLEKPEKLEFPTETWAAQDIRKSDVFCHAARHANGREHELFADKARFFHATSTRTLAQVPTRALARPVVVLLTSGQIMSSLSVKAEPADGSPPATVDWGSPSRFIPQRERAMRRAIWLATGAAAVVVLALSVYLF